MARCESGCVRITDWPGSANHWAVRDAGPRAGRGGRGLRGLTDTPLCVRDRLLSPAAERCGVLLHLRGRARLRRDYRGRAGGTRPRLEGYTGRVWPGHDLETDP